MSLDRPGAERLRDVEQDVRELREFAASVRGALRLLIAVQGLLIAGVAYTAFHMATS